MSKSAKWEYAIVSVPHSKFDETGLADDQSTLKRAEYEYEFRNDTWVPNYLTLMAKVGWELIATVQRDEPRVILIFKRPTEEG